MEQIGIHCKNHAHGHQCHPLSFRMFLSNRENEQYHSVCKCVSEAKTLMSLI